ncbi:hypothetical protein LSTR_LSTR006118 [Laodelphax striatellus]|uniref:Uncharacterized protein n=1 Tax=Laodelphax striatellus TaxID=195883 RepID=A0A482WYF1_LAOST|nr:hypothetical protein LSTR_LSTR006118 [Laodelphax striatellus]
MFVYYSYYGKRSPSARSDYAVNGLGRGRLFCRLSLLLSRIAAGRRQSGGWRVQWGGGRARYLTAVSKAMQWQLTRGRQQQPNLVTSSTTVAFLTNSSAARATCALCE